MSPDSVSCEIWEQVQVPKIQRDVKRLGYKQRSILCESCTALSILHTEMIVLEILGPPGLKISCMTLGPNSKSRSTVRLLFLFLVASDIENKRHGIENCDTQVALCGLVSE